MSMLKGVLPSLLAAILVVSFGLLADPSPLSAQTIPSDAQTTCTVAPADFAGWFETGTPAVSGVVKPADSLNFPDQPNCSFYQWAEQMFLWLSPRPRRLPIAAAAPMFLIRRPSLMFRLPMRAATAP